MNSILKPVKAVQTTESVATTIQQLSKLPPLEYEMERKAKAKLLGIKVSTLDKEVASCREPDTAEYVSEALDLTPAEDPVDGIEVFQQMNSIIKNYIHLSDPEMAEVVAIWCMYTYAIDSFRIAPKLLVTAPTKSSGKSTLLEVVAALSCRCESLIGASPAIIYRLVELYKPTLAFDEFDNLLNGSNYDELSGIINGAHKRGVYVWRADGENFKPKRYNVFGPQVLAMIGKPKGTTESRSIKVVLERATEEEENYLLDISDINAMTDWKPLRRQALRWAVDNAERLSLSPSFPVGVYGRHKDNWRPMLRVAECLSDCVAVKIRSICKSQAIAKEATTGFSDNVFLSMKVIIEEYKNDNPGESIIHSSELYKRLSESDSIPSHWRPTKLTQFISNYKVTPTRGLACGRNLRGFNLTQIENLIDRYVSIKEPP